MAGPHTNILCGKLSPKFPRIVLVPVLVAALAIWTGFSLSTESNQNAKQIRESPLEISAHAKLRPLPEKSHKHRAANQLVALGGWSTAEAIGSRSARAAYSASWSTVQTFTRGLESQGNSDQVEPEPTEDTQTESDLVRTFEGVFFAFALSDGTALTFEDTENGFSMSRRTIYTESPPQKIFELESEMSMRPVLSSDGSLVIVGTADKTAYVVSSEDGEVIRAYGGSAGLQGGGLTPDNSLVLIARSDNTVRIWDVETGRPVQNIDVQSTASGGVVSQDKSRIWTFHEDIVKEWSMSSGNLISEFDGPPVSIENIVTLTSNSSADEIAYITKRGEADMWSLETRRLLSRTNIGDAVEDGIINPRTGAVIVLFQDEPKPRVANANGEGEISAPIDHSNVQTVTFSPDDSMFVTISQNREAKVWNLSSY